MAKVLICLPKVITYIIQWLHVFRSINFIVFPLNYLITCSYSKYVNYRFPTSKSWPVLFTFDQFLTTWKAVIDWSIIKYKKPYNYSLRLNVVTYREQNMNCRTETRLSRDILICCQTSANQHEDSLTKNESVNRLDWMPIYWVSDEFPFATETEL